MRDLILERERGGTGMHSSAVGGWSSHKDLLSWNAPCIKELEQMFRRVAVEATRATTRKHKRGDYPFEMEAWANILRPSGYHVPHSHESSTWSGVYYVAVGALDTGHPISGQLELLDPRTGVQASTLGERMFNQHWRMGPKPGSMVIFPGWLKHLVHPYFGAGERIAVSFNARHPS